MKKIKYLLIGLLILVSLAIAAEKALGNHIIDAAKCTACGACTEVCPEEAISEGKVDDKDVYIIDPKLCIDCGACVEVCPEEAISNSAEKE